MLDIQALSSVLKLADDGIWYSAENQEVSYPSSGNEDCFSVEDNSFWFRHRNNCIASIVRAYPPPTGGAIFDVGGGNGFVSLGLINAGFDVVLVEPGFAGANAARQRGVKDVICATSETAKFQQNSLHAVGLFDVIEHIDDDKSFLQSIRYAMKEDGNLYITVPSYSFLWSAEDVLAGHFRRYTLKSISDLLVSSGFEVVFSSYIFRFLPIPIFLLRSLPYKIGWRGNDRPHRDISSDHAIKSSSFSHLLDAFLEPEIKKLENRKSMNFGGSCLVVAKCHKQAIV